MSQHIGCHNLLHGFNPPWSTQPCRIQRLFLPWGSTIGRVDSNRFEILWQAMLIIWLCWLGLFMLHYIFLWFSHDRRVFSDFDHPVTFSCCRCDWCTSSSYWCSTTSTCSVLGRGPQGSSGLKFSEEWPLIFVYPFGIIQPTRIKNNIQILFAISAISFISLSDKFHIFLSFGGRFFFFALCFRCFLKHFHNGVCGRPTGTGKSVNISLWLQKQVGSWLSWLYGESFFVDDNDN